MYRGYAFDVINYASPILRSGRAHFFLAYEVIKMVHSSCCVVGCTNRQGRDKGFGFYQVRLVA